MMIIAISARGTMLMPISVAPAALVVSNAGMPAPTTLPMTRSGAS
jgi:hypothetical protein